MFQLWDILSLYIIAYNGVIIASIHDGLAFSCLVFQFIVTFCILFVNTVYC